MKKFQIRSWEGVLPDGKKTQESLVSVLSYIISVSANNLPNGMEQFRCLRRMAEAFDNAEKTKTLELEDKDHTLLKDLLEKNIPPRWALSKDIAGVVEEFMSL
jgi:hypothetical protein